MDSIVRKLLNREVILYGIFGILTSILNIVLYAYLSGNIGIDYKIANIITLIIVKLTAYVVNKLFVFQTKTENILELVKEFMRFVITRGLTMVVDFFGVIFFVEVLMIDSMISKIIFTIIVVILNYVFGKWHVFKK